MNILESTSPNELHARIKKIRLLILDVDGVLSDGKIYFSNSGEEMKCFNTLDGQGIKVLQQTGVEVAIITGRKSKLVEKRANDLGIKLLMQGREDKFDALTEMLANFPCDLNRIAFMGDDLPDLRVMIKVGLSLSVFNAHPEVTKRSHWQSTERGGNGAVRQACDLIMDAQGTYEEALQAFLCE